MLTCRCKYAMITCICTSVHSFLSINLSPSQSLSRISLHLSVFEPNKFNQHTFPLILQQQTGDWVFKPGKPLSTGLSCRPSVEEKPPMWAWTQGVHLGFKSPRGALGVLPAGKEVTSQPYLMGFWFPLPPLGSPLWPRPSFQVSVWSGRQKGHNPCGHSRSGAMAGGWP